MYNRQEVVNMYIFKDLCDAMQMTLSSASLASQTPGLY